MLKTFISYSRNNAVSATAAETFELKMSINLDNTRFSSPFRDQKDIEVGDVVPDKIGAAVRECDLFLCLLSDAYWTSKWCQAELQIAVDRWTGTSEPRLLFVLVQRMNIHALKVLNTATDGSGVATPDVGAFTTLGNINFLGPFNGVGQLTHLDSVDTARDDQIYDMVMRVGSLGA